MFSNFTATMGEVVIEWMPEAPYLKGNAPAIERVLNEINANALIMLTPSGPRVISVEYDAAVVFVVISKLFRNEVTFENAPDISLLWKEETSPGDLENEVQY